MRLVSLAVENFGCVRSAKVEFTPGLNVLFGPNDLGKSSLIEAVRAALLLPHSSAAHQNFVPWQGDLVPKLDLVVELERPYRIRKSFGIGARGSSLLESSADGENWVEEARARQVDDQLRRVLRLGVPLPGGRGAPRGLPESFLTALLLPDQADVTAVLKKERGLDQDTDPSGRQRIAEALSAMARDPQFVAVLELVQSRVDEAFSPSGQWKRGKDAPLVRIQGLLNGVEAELSLLAEEEAAGVEIRRRLDELYQERYARRQESGWLQERSRLAQAEWELAARETVVKRAKEGERQLGALKEAVRSATEEHQKRLKALEEARAALRVAEGAKDRLHSQGAAAEIALRRKDLENRALGLDGEQARVASDAAAAKEALALAEELGRAQEHIGKQEASFEGLNNRIAAAERAASEADAEMALLNAVDLVMKRDRAAEELELLEKRLAESAGLRVQAAELRAVAERERQAAVGTPDVQQLTAAEKIAENLRLAEARTQVGLHVVLRPQHAIDLQLTQDGRPGEARHGIDHSIVIDAEREVSIQVPDVLDLVVSGGGRDAHDALVEARHRFEAEVAPVLLAASVTTIEAMRAVVDSAAERRAQATRMEQEARSLEAQALGLSDSAGATPDAARRRLQEHDVELTGVDIAQIRNRAPLLPEPRERSLDEKRRAKEQYRSKTLAQAQALRVSAAGMEAELRMLRDRLGQLRVDLVELTAQFSGKQPAEVEAACASRLLELTQSVDRVKSELTQLELGEQHALEVTERALNGATSMVAEAVLAEAKARDGVEATKKALHEFSGIQQRQREEAGLADVAGQRDQVDQLQGRLAATHCPSSDLKTVAPAELRNAEARAAEALRKVEREVDQAEGRLQGTGGVVAMEHARELREAKRRLEHQLQDAQLDFEAWRLLGETLKEADGEEAAHLGRTLMPAVHGRFSQLTGQRYGELVLGPGLEPEGVGAVGRPRPIDALSVGTQEQVATIFRLALAEQLKTAVILDDQLTQTDPARMRFFRDLLRHAAGAIQVIVVTCHPDDYLLPQEVPGPDGPVRDTGLVHAIDLEAVVARA